MDSSIRHLFGPDQSKVAGSVWTTKSWVREDWARKSGREASRTAS